MLGIAPDTEEADLILAIRELSVWAYSSASKVSATEYNKVQVYFFPEGPVYLMPLIISTPSSPTIDLCIDRWSWPRSKDHLEDFSVSLTEEQAWAVHTLSLLLQIHVPH